MAGTLGNLFNSGELWIKTSKFNYDLNNYSTMDFEPEDFSENSQFKRLADLFFNTQVTGLKLKLSASRRKYLLEFEEDDTYYEFKIDIKSLQDDYFIVDVRYPLVEKHPIFRKVGRVDSEPEVPNQIAIVEERFLIDGIDGFYAWADDNQVNREEKDFFKIVYLKLPDQDNLQIIKSGDPSGEMTIFSHYDYKNIQNLEENYPHIFVSVSDANHGKRFFFQKDKSGNYAPYAMKLNHNAYLYRTGEEKMRRAKWKADYNRLYEIWRDFYYVKKNMGNLTEEEISFLRSNLHNPSFRVSVEETQANFGSEEIYQRCLELMDKLQGGAKFESMRYLVKYNRFLK